MHSMDRHLLGVAICCCAQPGSASVDVSCQLATMICYTFASVCGTGADAVVGLAAVLCHALLYSFACRLSLATPGSLARYEAVHHAAAGCAYVAAPNEIAWYLALTHAAAGWAWAAALEGTARCVALLTEAVCWACAAAPGGIRVGSESHSTLPCCTLQGAGPAPLRLARAHRMLICHTQQWDGPALQRPKGLNGTLLCYALAAGWACAAAPDEIAWCVALLYAPLRGTRRAAPCWPVES